MILFDIGNTTISSYNDGQISSTSIDDISIFPKNDIFFYISVNDNISAMLHLYQNGIDLKDYLKLDTSYIGLGVDRIAACSVVSDGVVVDVGSAITVDVMSNNIHLGGYILPGILAQKESYKRISNRLNPSIETICEAGIIPQSTKEAINCGLLMPIIYLIKEVKKSKTVYFTGGDGKYFTKFFDDSIYDATMVFRGMLKAIETNKLKERYLC